MPIKRARYRIVDAGATGPEAIARAFENQVAYCRDNGAPITARVCQALLDLLPERRGGVMMLRVRKWVGPALADALPLRVAGGLHALYLAGAEPRLAPIYQGREPRNAKTLIADALELHEAALLPWLEGPPQTNEAGRASSYAAALLWLAAQGLPGRFELLEIGSSAGINLMMDRFRFDLGGVTIGPEDASIALTPDWRGEPPPARAFEIVSAQGCDIAPLHLDDPADALRLRAYIWPEFTQRFARMEAAIAMAKSAPPRLASEIAGDWLTARLRERPEPGVTRVVMHSVVWQYLSESERHRLIEVIEHAGARATPDSPLAWVSLEANRDTHRHELTVCYWPDGEERRRLATAHPHGTWIEWDG